MGRKILLMVFVWAVFLATVGYAKAPLWYRENIQIPPEIVKATTISEIKPFLMSSDEKIRISAVRRLGQIGDKNAVKVLAETFEREPYGKPSFEDFPYVKEEIIDALAKIGGKEAKYGLFKIFKDYIIKGPNIPKDNPRIYFYCDGDYASVARATSQVLYNLYDPKEDEEIYNFFKPIALNEIKDKFIMQNNNLRITACKIYFKTEIFQKGISKEEIPKYIEESIKPYTKDEGYGWESPGILSQKTVERGAKEELLREYAK